MSVPLPCAHRPRARPRDARRIDLPALRHHLTIAALAAATTALPKLTLAEPRRGRAELPEARAEARPSHGDSPSPRSEARALAEHGDELFEIGRCDLAIDTWRKAYAKFHAPTILLRVARCQALVGKVVDAARTLETITREPLDPRAPAPFIDAKRAAEHDLEGVRARIASLKITLESRPGLPGEPALEIDDKRFPGAAISAPIALDPGRHIIRVRVGASATLSERTVELGDGEIQSLRIALWAEPPRASRGPNAKQLGIVIGGLGASALAVSVGFGASAMGTSRGLDLVCGEDHRQCPAPEQRTIERLKAQSLITDITLAGGTAFLAASALLLVLDPRTAPEPPRVRVRFVAGARGAGGSPVGAPFAGLVVSGAY
jgi:hypothetical protein